MKRSTLRTDRKEAQRLADEWEALARKARDGELFEGQVRTVINDILRRTDLDQVERVTLRGYVEGYHARLERTKAWRSAAAYRQCFAEFVAFLGKKADRPLEAIGPADVRAFMEAGMRAGLSASTVNKFRKMLSKLFRDAWKEQLIANVPTAAVEEFSSVPKERAPFSVDQIRALLKVADEDWRGMILLSYSTGMRIDDAGNLQWSEIDLGRRVIRFRPGKDPKKRLILAPISAEFFDYLRSRHDPKQPPEAPLFPTLYGKNRGNASFSKRFTRLMRRAGIEKGGGEPSDVAKGRGRRVSELTYHSLRHSCTSALANADVPQELRQKITGHRSESVHQLYTHMEIETLSRAIDRLPRIEEVEP